MHTRHVVHTASGGVNGSGSAIPATVNVGDGISTYGGTSNVANGSAHVRYLPLREGAQLTMQDVPDAT